jgi:DNA-binding NarL/FixJ family response regulator
MTMPAGEHLKVLVVDDDPAIRRGLTLILKSEPDVTVVGEAGDGVDALVHAERLLPDVVLMDLRMPRLDGLSATRRLKAESPDTRVIVLSVYADRLEAALAAGADQFLLKDCTVDQLLDAVRGGGSHLEAPSSDEANGIGGRGEADSSPRSKEKGDI